MIFELDEKAKSWIETKGKHLTVNTVEVQGCCAVGVQDLLAIPKKPKDTHRYNIYEVDNLSIYIQKNINVRDKISLKNDRHWFFKRHIGKIKLVNRYKNCAIHKGLANSQSFAPSKGGLI
ncbi:Fe-S oxidoreductase [Bacillus infantis]|uniref:CC/Se motif family (seleno)protein n=1 Tax=Bacillus infantis TaxID=324767 RepID=UPI0020063D26|nr:CC/Se motif family (seleno)protein [Bacillus infantis]MCK6205748.1 Fe-S oxidoreductase [Bacillus infantis]